MAGELMTRRRRRLAMLIVVAGLTARCGDVNVALGQLGEARRLSADLLIEFTKASDAADRAVMADTDAMSIADAHDAVIAKQTVHKDVDALGPILQQRLRYTEESRLLQDFVTRFAAYEALDRRILDLAVENTNLKAQGLAFGPAEAAADQFRDALEALAPARDEWHVKAMVASAVAAVREIQALQAPHIAEAEDASMTRLEQRMTAAEGAARRALEALGPLVQPASRPGLAAATAALDRFVDLNRQIVALSRRNTNVRSLALSLDEKRKVTGPCEESLRALQAALGRHAYAGGLHPGGR
jgi:hypothetical protein